MKEPQTKTKNKYNPPRMYSENIHLEGGIAAQSLVIPTDVDGKIYDITTEESIGESLDW